MSSDADAAAAAAAAEEPSEDFKLLDVEGSGGGYSSGPSSAAAAPASGSKEADKPLGAQMARYAWTGMNVAISCSALAVAKQILNPANFSAAAQEAAAAEASQQLPDWFAAQYKQRRAATAVTHLIAKDTGILMAASGIWYGLQAGLKQLRGQDDALNVCVAGSVSAGFLGATFFEPVKWSRASIWSLVGGLAGYYGYREQQSLRAALLEKQQELEQKHLKVAEDQVHQKLDAKLLRRLLEMEQLERRQQFQAAMEQQGVPAPAPAGGSDGGGGGGSGPPGGSDAGGGSGGWGTAGQQASPFPAEGGEDEWQRLLNAAPWLQEPQADAGPGAAAAQAQAESSRRQQ